MSMSKVIFNIAKTTMFTAALTICMSTYSSACGRTIPVTSGVTEKQTSNGPLTIVEEYSIPITSTAINKWIEGGCLSQEGIPFTSTAIEEWMEDGCKADTIIGKAIIEYNSRNNILIIEENEKWLTIVETYPIPITSGGLEEN